MKTLWSLLLGAVVFASALSSVPGALGAPSGDTSCSAAGSGTTFSIDLIIPASALPQQGVAIGIQGGTVTAISIDGYQGTFSTSGLPAGASGEELVSQAFSTGTIVVHVTLSAAPTSSVIVIFPTNSPT